MGNTPAMQGMYKYTTEADSGVVVELQKAWKTVETDR